MTCCEPSNIKFFAQTASKGKSSMGWFFGFKLHLIVNHKGQIVDFALTTGTGGRQ
ncbi:MAG: hypothetical protein IPI59_14540 [Sphingobacteriales bacterium]|nr:hypothetical protein [Sphingobacteriales bacterium]